MLQHVFSRYLIFSECNNQFLSYSRETDLNFCLDFFLNFDLFQMCQLNLEFIVSEQF